MGKTVTPKYRLEWTETNTQTGRVEHHRVGWNKEYGTANNQNAIRYLRSYEASTRSGGCNEQIGPRTVVRFSVVDQVANKTVCSQSLSQIE